MGEEYSYVLDLFRENGSLVGQASVAPDWLPAIDWCRFSAIRADLCPPVMNGEGHSIKPLWDSKIGQPHIAGVRVVLSGKNGKQRFSGEIPTAYFSGLAQQAASLFVKRGLLRAGDVFWCRVSAFPAETDRSDEPENPQGISVHKIERPLPLSPKPLEGLLNGAEFLGQAHRADFPVFIPQQILDEISTCTTGAKDANEIGGILIGRLHRDTASSEILAQVTAQIPAKHTDSKINRLTFTKETWTSIRAAIDLRGKEELMLGWWHTHNFMMETCKGCEKASQGKCPSPIFMSSQDTHFHRTVFARPWSIALVAGESPCAGLQYELFGWRYGMIQPRGLYVVNPSSIARPVTRLRQDAP
jgi:hypothetical protein